ncbi:MAG: RNA polymerase sigma factor [Phycisphaerales bacterium]|nr:RNA polymerase sigma factor [Phycisphaerales bacterium]
MTASLLERVARGDESAVRDSLEAYSPLVWSLARRLCHDRAEAEDAVQEIFVDLWRSAGRFNPAVASEPTFVAMIARRRLIDRLRRAGRRIAPVAMPEGDVSSAGMATPAAPAELSEEARVALDAMRSLSDEQQRVLQLSIMQGRSHAEIAQITGMPLGTVKTHARRGLIRIREALDPSRSGRPQPAAGGGA